jgi:ArsR family transcriptional regulator
VNRAYVKALKALGDPNRIRILKMLGEKQLCLREIREILGFQTPQSQSISPTYGLQGF